jgi:hypothetical protein
MFIVISLYLDYELAIPAAQTGVPVTDCPPQPG